MAISDIILPGTSKDILHDDCSPRDSKVVGIQIYAQVKFFVCNLFCWSIKV